MMNAPVQAATAFQRGLEKAGKLIEPGELTRKRKQLARCLLRLAKPGEARRCREQMTDPDRESDPEYSWLFSRCDLQEGKTSPGWAQKQLRPTVRRIR